MPSSETPLNQCWWCLGGIACAMANMGYSCIFGETIECRRTGVYRCTGDLAICVRTAPTCILWGDPRRVVNNLIVQTQLVQNSLSATAIACTTLLIAFGSDGDANTRWYDQHIIMSNNRTTRSTYTCIPPGGDIQRSSTVCRCHPVGGLNA